ncbi:MAG: tetratricopeptide repeat protein [Halofilum sp. (in: g-proteobacteria)]
MFAPSLRADVEGPFARGVDAARAGNYAEAIDHFRAARAAGLDTPALHFNLGVALYRLGQLEQAAEALRIAASSTELAGPAAYNLGRIARERGEQQQAQEWFRLAADRAQTDAVRRRALAQLKEPEPDHSVSGSLTIGLGYDSNIALAPSDDTRYSRVSDPFLLTDLFARYPISEQWQISAGAYQERYANEGDFSFSAFHGTISWWPRTSSAYWMSHRMTLRHTRFGGDSFENAVIWESQVGRDIGSGHLTLGLGLEGLRGAAGFDYLDGHRGSIETIWYQPGLGGRWHVGHRLVTVDRADWGEDGLSYSYSYRRNDLFGSYWRDLAGSLRGGIEAGVRRYRYDDRNTVEHHESRRRERVRYLAGEARLTARGGWQVALRIERQLRHSNIEAYEYERDLATAQVTWQF